MSTKKSPLRDMLTIKNSVGIVALVIVAQELFGLINSLKGNLFLPTIANILNQGKIESWKLSSGKICFHYGKFLWSFISFIVFMTLFYVVFAVFQKVQRRMQK